MTKEQLDNYNKKINNLSKEEQKLRDLYLRKIATGEYQGPQTGYSSIDKPWLKWESEDNILRDYDTTNICDYFFKMVSSKGKILEYCGAEFTKDDIKKKVNEYICMFGNLGVKEGESVSLLFLDVPECLFMILALAKMGVTSNVIKCDEGPDRIKNMVNIGKSDYMFISDVPFLIDNVVESIKQGNNIKKVITVPMQNELSLTDTAKFLYKMATKGKETKEEKLEAIKGFLKEYKDNQPKKKEFYEKNDTFMTLKDFKKKYRFRLKDERVKTVRNAKDAVAVISYTGGTTGSAKGVELTNENIIASTHALKYSGLGFDEGKTSMNILPPGPSYYLHAVYALLCCGVKVSLVPVFELEDYPSLVKEYEPNILFAGPILFKLMVDQDVLDNGSFLTDPMSGGDKYHESEERRFNDYLKRIGSSAVSRQGYGETETTGAATVCKQSAYKLGSIGEPILGVDVGIFEYGTDSELRAGEIGEICISGPTIMKGYRNEPEATKEVLRVHTDGKSWIHTDDLGNMDEDGRLFHCGRAKRMLTRSGAKVWLAALEDIIKQNDNVFDCCCVKLNDEDEREVPVAHIVFKDVSKAKQSIEEIDNAIKACQPLTYVPKYYILKDEIPVTKVNNKIDFKTLEKENILDSNDYDIEERVIKPKTLKL